jgi:hypothetical protein
VEEPSVIDPEALLLGGEKGVLYEQVTGVKVLGFFLYQGLCFCCLTPFSSVVVTKGHEQLIPFHGTNWPR